jgi:hypothetical protein
MSDYHVTLSLYLPSKDAALATLEEALKLPKVSLKHCCESTEKIGNLPVRLRWIIK